MWDDGGGGSDAELMNYKQDYPHQSHQQRFKLSCNAITEVNTLLGFVTDSMRLFKIYIESCLKPFLNLSADQCLTKHNIPEYVPKVLLQAVYTEVPVILNNCHILATTLVHICTF